MSYVPPPQSRMDGPCLCQMWSGRSQAPPGRRSLVPAQYQAVATYSASTSYNVATGYITTAEYTGDVVSKGIEDITYTVVYTGSETIPVHGAGWIDGLPFPIPALILLAFLAWGCWRRGFFCSCAAKMSMFMCLEKSQGIQADCEVPG